jgi:hypothetical protein
MWIYNGHATIVEHTTEEHLIERDDMMQEGFKEKVMTKTSKDGDMLVRLMP